MVVRGHVCEVTGVLCVREERWFADEYARAGFLNSMSCRLADGVFVGVVCRYGVLIRRKIAKVMTEWDRTFSPTISALVLSI